MIQLIQNKNGLKHLNQQENPLFEKTYIPPGTGNKLVSRMYSDGSLYYLSQPESQEKEDQKWNFISFISEKGVSGIRGKLETLCHIKPQELKGNAMGATIWRFPCDKQVREHIIAGIPEGEDLIFLEIDHLVNTNIQIIPQE